MTQLFWFGFGVGSLFGGAVIGFIANKKPAWFSKVVAVANTVDAKVNQTVAPAASDAAKAAAQTIANVVTKGV